MRRFTERISLLYMREGSATSAHRLIFGLVLNAPRVSLKQEDWRVSKREREDFLVKI